MSEDKCQEDNNDVLQFRDRFKGILLRRRAVEQNRVMKQVLRNLEEKQKRTDDLQLKI
jgi:hypothetical protein